MWVFPQRYKDTSSYLFNVGSKNQNTHIKSSNTKYNKFALVVFSLNSQIDYQSVVDSRKYRNYDHQIEAGWHRC